jgi:hypothetical protein
MTDATSRGQTGATIPHHLLSYITSRCSLEADGISLASIPKNQCRGTGACERALTFISTDLVQHLGQHLRVTATSPERNKTFAPSAMGLDGLWVFESNFCLVWDQETALVLGRREKDPT